MATEDSTLARRGNLSADEELAIGVLIEQAQSIAKYVHEDEKYLQGEAAAGAILNLLAQAQDILCGGRPNE